MSEIKSIYIAGKMQVPDWRYKIFDEHFAHSDDHLYQLGYNPLTVEDDTEWPKSSHVTVCGLQYTGPFFVDIYGGHGTGYSEGSDHGNNISSKKFGEREKVQRWCFEAIARADVLFAWIDCIDCYGTIAEIGYAKALGKIIWIAGPREYYDLWFVYSMADYCEITNYSHEPLKDLLTEMINQHRRTYPHFDSPIEQAFWEAWHINMSDHSLYHLMDLIPQHPIGKYLVDFAHISTKTAIELDGFASHSSTEDIAKDRKRQREIEEQGWHVIRFGGKEIHHDALSCVIEAYNRILKRVSEATA